MSSFHTFTSDHTLRMQHFPLSRQSHCPKQCLTHIPPGLLGLVRPPHSQQHTHSHTTMLALPGCALVLVTQLCMFSRAVYPPPPSPRYICFVPLTAVTPHDGPPQPSPLHHTCLSLFTCPRTSSQACPCLEGFWPYRPCPSSHSETDEGTWRTLLQWFNRW